MENRYGAVTADGYEPTATSSRK